MQGIASALLTPASLAVIVATFPESERGGAIGAWTAWGTIAAVVDTFARAIETSDFERRLKIVEAERPACLTDVRGMFDGGNPGNSIYWREFAVDSR